MARAKVIGEKSDHLKFYCRGCNDHHVVVIPPHEKGWYWNGDVQNPTLSPSVLVQGGSKNITCHSFVLGGRMEYLSDSTHKLRGLTVELPQLEE